MALFQCEFVSASWFSSSQPQSQLPQESRKISELTTIPGEQLIQCSLERVNAYNSVPPVTGSGNGDLNWCRAIMKRAKTVM